MYRTVPAWLVVVLLATAGCSSSGAFSSARPDAGTPAASAAPTPTPSPAPAPLTGTRLKALLAPASAFPSGYRLVKNSAADTGADGVPTEVEHDLPCTGLDQTAWVSLSGITPRAFAQNSYVSASGQYAQEFDTYTVADAGWAMTGLRAAAARCDRFRDEQTRSTVTVRLVAPPRLGQDALAIKLTDPRWAGDVTLVAVRTGVTLVTVLYSSASGSSTPEATKLAAYLTRRVESAG